MYRVNYCGECGNKLDGNPKFCPKCGNRIADSTQLEESFVSCDHIENKNTPAERIDKNETISIKDKNRRNGLTRKLVIIAGIIITVLLSGIVVYTTQLSPVAQEKSQIRLGYKLLGEGKYEEAVLTFKMAIMINPGSIDARLGLSKVYVATNRFDKAEEVLKEALGIDGDRPDINAALSDIQSKNAANIDNGQGSQHFETAQVSGVKLGNSPGNIANGGYVASQGDWIYYVDQTAIYKIDKKDRTQKYEIIDTNEDVGYLNVIDDWIYFCTRENKDNNQYRNICKIKTDGTAYVKIYSWNAGSYSTEYFTNNADYHLANMMVINDVIYFNNESGNICKIKSDGTDFTKLNNDNCRSFYVSGNCIYYANLDDSVKYTYKDILGGGNCEVSAGKIYRINIDGTQKTVITDDGSDSLAVEDDWIYYSNYADGKPVGSEGDSWYEGTLYKISVDGTKKVKLSDSTCNSINVQDDWVYFRNWSHSGISKVKKDGSGETVLFSSTYNTGISIAGRDLFYYNLSEEEEREHNYEYCYTSGKNNPNEFSPRLLYSISIDNIKDAGKENPIGNGSSTVGNNTVNGDFIIPYSSERYLTEADIKDFSKDELALARNEIFARHGYVFNTDKYKDYFGKKAWYKPNPNFKETDLNDFEKYNASYIKKHE